LATGHFLAQKSGNTCGHIRLQKIGNVRHPHPVTFKVRPITVNPGSRLDAVAEPMSSKPQNRSPHPLIITPS